MLNPWTNTFGNWLVRSHCLCIHDKIKRSTNSTNNFVSRSVIKAGTVGIYQVVRD